MKKQYSAQVVIHPPDNPFEIRIPVGLKTAVSETKQPSFRVLHAECGSPVEVRKPSADEKAPEPKEGEGSSLQWCPKCEREATETRKGFEYAKGEFVMFSQAETDSMMEERSPFIRIDKFVPVADLKRVMVAGYYFLIPDEHMGEQYGVLYQGLAKTKAAGFGSHTLYGKEHPCAIVADQDWPGGVLMMWQLQLWEDVQQPDFQAPIPSKQAQDLVVEMVKAELTEFDPAVDLTSLQRIRVNEMITAKVAGKQPPKVDVEKDRETVPDIQDALRRMIDAKAKKPTQKRKTAARK